jgi:hypothetical protein
MRAALAFVNGAGSRWKRRDGGTDRGLLMLTDLLLNSGIASKPGVWKPGSWKTAADPASVDARAGRPPSRRSPRFARRT